jgi:uncharacterized protein
MKKGIAATVEVVIVLALALAAFRAVRASSIGQWEGQAVGFPFLEYALLLALVAAASFLARRSLAAGGLVLRPSGPGLKLAAAGALPVLAMSFALSWLGWQSWGTAAILSLIAVAILFLVSLLSREMESGEGRAKPGLMVLAPGLAFLALAQPAAAPPISLRLLGTLLLVAPAEELLFRGYIQSRLNAAFGRPFALLGARCGWGLVLTSVLFGAWHVLNPFDPFRGQFGLAWTWGLWTASLGLLLGWARERTGGLEAPWLWHALINL